MQQVPKWKRQTSSWPSLFPARDLVITLHPQGAPPTGPLTARSFNHSNLPLPSTLANMKLSNSMATPSMLMVPVMRAASWSPSRRNS